MRSRCTGTPQQSPAADGRARRQATGFSGLGKGHATETKPLSLQEAYGNGAIKWHGHGDEVRFRFLATETKPADMAPAKPTVNRSATLQAWYPPAADLAQSRPVLATYQANRAVEDYKSTVADPEFAHPALAARFNQRAKNDSQQLAIRLIHAAMEDTPQPLIFEPAMSTADARQKLVSALNSTAALSARPFGTVVWGDLLTQEFPPAVYQWSGRTLATDAAGMVRYRVDSPLLPPTVTAIDVQAYAQAAVKRHEQFRNALGLKSQPAVRRAPFDWNLKTPTEGK